MNIPLSDITVNARKRSLNPAKVAELFESISKRGQLEPIVVSQDHVLVIGLHRLTAMRQLGAATIAATVKHYDSPLDMELDEIDENLIRNELNALEESQHLKRRKEIYELKYPQTKAHVAGGTAKARNATTAESAVVAKTPSFVSATASATGMPERTVFKKIQLATNLTEEVQTAIKDTPLAAQKTELLKLARMEPERQAEVVTQIVTGTAKTVKDVELHEAKASHQQHTTVATALNPPQVTCADWQEWLEPLPCCDLLITDPVYSTDIDGDLQEYASWIARALLRVKRTGRAFVCIGAYPDELRAYLTQAIPTHMTLDQVLIWTYKNTLGAKPVDRYIQNYQAILSFKGVDAGALDCPLTSEQFAVMEINAPDGRQGDRFHTWQKPLELAERLIRHTTKPGDTVFDCFAGTGTFLLAAAKLGRLACGCDHDPAMIEIARQRGCYVGI